MGGEYTDRPRFLLVCNMEYILISLPLGWTCNPPQSPNKARSATSTLTWRVQFYLGILNELDELEVRDVLVWKPL